jgi:hypothetical protein
MLDAIAGMEVTLLADTLIDVRQETRPDQLSLDGLRWLRRVAQRYRRDGGAALGDGRHASARR